MKYFFIVGEASGDLHASNLMKALKQEDSDATFAFMGGDKMEEVSKTPPLIHYKEMAFMGIIPVIKNIHTIKDNATKLQQYIKDFNPDIVIPVDYGSFSFKYILPFVRKNTKAKTAYFIAPKVWAWKKWRIKTLRKYTDLLLCILPFEEEYFRNKNINARYVGNPCVDAIIQSKCRKDIENYKWGEYKQIAILSGSRKQELNDNLEISIKAIDSLSNENKIVVAGAPSLTSKDYDKVLSKYPYINIEFDNTYQILKNSDIAIVTSGTATLETALIGTPQVVIYRMGGNPFVRSIFKHFFSVPFISLVNIIANKSVVKELLGHEVNSKNIFNEVEKIKQDKSYRDDMIKGYLDVQNILGNSDSSAKSAKLIIELANCI